jgi:signal recognition particle GTPase
LPETVQDAGAFVRESRVGDRCELAGGDFFQAVPPAADVYILKSVLHDWYDEDAGRILKAIRAAARPDTVLLVIDVVIGAPNQETPAKFGDLNIVVAAGGRERTRAEWEQL